MFARALLVLLCAFAGAASADGKRDLEDGIAFYENLDTDRALERLRSASTAKDLPAPERARAFLYLGIVQYEIGKEREAEESWREAFALAPKAAVPAGTSPKVVAAIDRARKLTAAPPTPAITPSPSPSASPLSKPPPSPTPSPAPFADPPPPSPEPALTEAAPEPAEGEDDGFPSWILWGGIGAAVVGGAVTAILLATAPCASSGGCLEVEVR